MKILFSFLLVCITSFYTTAQSTEEITEYFDKNWKTTTSPSNAAYYRTVEKLETSYIVREYFISGKIQREAICSSFKPKLIQEGKTILYYENGNLREVGSFKNNNRIGLYKSFYENGDPEREMNYDRKKPVYIHCYSQSGEELLKRGAGLIEVPVKDNAYKGYVEIEDSIAIGSFHVDNHTADTVYLIVQKNAEYKRGINQMNQDLGSFVKYPKNARRMGIEGTVFVSFIITKTGNVKDPKIIKGIDSECDNVALQAVSQLGQWTPAVHKNETVQSLFVIPINFRLK